MPNRASVIAEMEMLGIGADEQVKADKSLVHGGKNGTPLTTEAAIAAQRVAIEDISEMADKMSARIQEIRDIVKVEDEALVELEVRLASLNTKEG